MRDYSTTCISSSSSSSSENTSPDINLSNEALQFECTRGHWNSNHVNTLLLRQITGRHHSRRVDSKISTRAANPPGTIALVSQSQLYN